MGEVAGFAFIYRNGSDCIFRTDFRILKAEGHFEKKKKGFGEPHRMKKSNSQILNTWNVGKKRWKAYIEQNKNKNATSNIIGYCRCL